MDAGQFYLVRYRYAKAFRVTSLITLLLGLLSLLMSVVVSPQTSALTTVPTKMNFQGRLTDSDGSIKPSGSYNMRLKLYTVSSGGASVWSEDRLVSATQGVTVTNGQFAIQLGDITTLPSSLFASGPLYLEIELPTPATATTSSPTWTEGAMTPRNQMATSAYAYNAETLDGLDSAAFGQIGGNNTWTGTNAFNGSAFTVSSSTAVSIGSNEDISVGATGLLELIGDTQLNINSGGGLSMQSSGLLSFYSNSDVTVDSANLIMSSGDVDINTTVLEMRQDQYGDPIFTVDTLNSTVRVGPDSSDSFAVQFVLDRKSGADPSAWGDGVMYYNTTLAKFRCFQFGGWVDCISRQGILPGDNVTWSGTHNFNGATFSIAGSANAAKFNVASLFNVDSTNSIISVGVSNTTGTVFVLDTKTDAGDPTGANGAMYYNSNTSKFRCYQAGTWIDCIAAGGTATNQIAYTNSTGGATPEIKLDSTRGAVDIQDADTTTGASLLNVRASNAAGLGAALFTVGNTGDTLFKNSIDSTAAFAIQDSAGKGLLEVDTVADQVQIGDGTADAVGVVLILDTKNTASDPTGVAGGMYYNSSLARFRCYENGAWRNCTGVTATNLTTTTQSMTAALDTYITGSSVTLPSYGLTGPSGGLSNGTLITWKVYITKTAAGTLASTLTLRAGTGAAITDASRCTPFSTGTGTAAVDGAVLLVTAYATAGGASTTLNCSATLTHQTGATGFANVPMVQSYSTQAAFDTTVAGTKMGLSFTAGVASTMTIQKVEVTATNL